MEQLSLLPPAAPVKTPAKKPEPLAPTHNAATNCVEVLIMLPGLEAQTYTYLAPEESLLAGTLVSVSFGKQPNPVPGIVVGPAAPPASTIRLKPIIAILDPEPLFGQDYLDLLHWMARYTATPLSQVIACALPAVLLQSATRRLFWLQNESESPPESIALSEDLAQLAQWLQASPKGLTAKALALKLDCPLNALSARLKPLIQTGLADWSLGDPPKPKRAVAHLIGVMPQSPDAKLSPKKLSQKQLALLAQLEALLQEFPEGLPLKTVEKRAKTTVATLHKLADAGYLQLENRVSDTLKPDHWPETSPESLQASYALLLPEQRDAVTAINSMPIDQSVLIHGVTGSGKTEIYLQLAAEAMARGHQVLLIVPEIVLASHLSHRFIKRFGQQALCIWHSQVASGEKLRTWRGIQSGEIPLIIGARSAVFAPFKHLGLLIIDESHEDSLKQDAPAPRYDARTAARFLARQHHARLVFGSATPDVAMTYEHTVLGGNVTWGVAPNPIGGTKISEASLAKPSIGQGLGEGALAPLPILALNAGVWGNSVPPAGLGGAQETSFSKTESPLVMLTKRWSQHGLPPVEIVAHRGGPPHGVLSGALKTALQETLTAGHQAILLMNRRGFHTTLKCQMCQEIVGCPHCDVPMTVHGASEGSSSCLKCHHCGYQTPKPSFCPSCASPRLMAMGSGTQRIETVLAEAFPGLRLGRLDGDTVRHKKHFAELMHAFDTRQLDCLVGTQMVAKGLDNPNVTLVGVIQADAGFVIPDFKSSERTFQMLTQVAGRAGRGEWPGRVIFQVFDPAHPVLGMAQGHDYAAFYDLELESRRRLKLPPFCQLIRFGLSSESMEEAVGFGEGLARQLKQTIAQAEMGEALEILGPAPCLIPRVNNRYRMHVLVKNTGGESGHHLVTGFYSGIRSPKTIRLSIDVDCLSLT